MTSKHFFSDTAGVVVLGLEALVARNNHLELDAPNKVVYKRSHATSKVSIISGGGAGHEPAWSGYVGDGMLAASVSGEVFASPSTKQIMAAIEHVPSDAGIILCITNYTGDCLHFGLAREKAAGLGHNIGMLRMSEDVGLGRAQTENTGRRGLAGNMFVLKLCGSASQKDFSFEDIMKIGQSVNDNCGTIGSALDYCHIPGRAHEEHLGPDVLSVAQGIHNEPGLIELSPIPPAKQLISDLLRFLVDPSDKDRAFVSYDSADDTALLINNFGGMSNLELEALTTITLRVLDQEYQIKPKRIYVQSFETSLNAPGWSISLLNISGISRETDHSTSTLFELLDLDTNAPAWPRNGYLASTTPSTSSTQKATSTAESTSTIPGPKVAPHRLSLALQRACEAVLAAEPEITKWDIIAGDGDCGEAVAAISNSILSKVNNNLCTQHDSLMFPILDAIGDSIEDVGGTLGAILAIYVASFTSFLRGIIAKGEKVNYHSLPEACGSALRNLQTYTGARVGGRTVMDALIPFVEKLQETHGDLKAAVEAADRGAKETMGMSAKYGRASYLGEKKTGDELPIDPGAWALVCFVKGLQEGFAEGAEKDSTESQ